MADNLEVKLEHKKYPIVTVKGEIDVYSYQGFNKVILDLISNKNYQLVINLEGVSYIDSTGLGVLANGANKISQNGGMIRVICTKSNIKKIFAISGLTEKNFKVFNNEVEALAAE
jgi:anti-sigma B factor antagonist